MTLRLDPARHRYTPEEYLALEEKAAYKSEYYHGEIFAMVGGTVAHTRIMGNLAASLVTQLRGRPCEAFVAEMKIMTVQRDAFFYPDLSVVCGEPAFHDDAQTALTNPRAIFEVLSPSTEAFDREEKFAAYAEIESLTDYILVSQHKPWIEHFVREANGWLYRTATDLAGGFEIPSIGCRLALADIYERVRFPTLSRGAPSGENG